MSSLPLVVPISNGNNLISTLTPQNVTRTGGGRRIGIIFCKWKRPIALTHHQQQPRLEPPQAPLYCSPHNSCGNTSDDHHNSANHGGLTGKDEKAHAEKFTSTEILKKLRRYGISGILSYGLLNTAYYLTAFLLVWFYIAPAPGKMGFRAAAERFLKMMAMVWAGSQVTKLIRAAGALALAPFVDKGLSWFTVKFNFESEGKAFLVIVGFCLGLALVLFFTIALLSA